MSFEPVELVTSNWRNPVFRRALAATFVLAAVSWTNTHVIAEQGMEGSEPRIPAPANSVEDRSYKQASSIKRRAEEAILKGDFAAAFDLALPLADNGDPEAQYFVSIIFGRHIYGGRVAGKDSEKSIEELASKKEIDWKNIPKDTNLSLKYLEKSALQNFPPALFNLGTAYLVGKHFDRNEVKGFSLVEKSATLGYRKAQQFLIRMNLIDSNYANAFKWAVAAVGCSEQGLSKLKEMLGPVFKKVLTAAKKQGTAMAMEHFKSRGEECRREHIEAVLATE